MPDHCSSSSCADVAGGKIVLQTAYVNLFRCRSIPGGWWDAARRVWLYPATAQHARLIRSSIPQLEASERFAALLGRNGQVVAAPAKPAPELPAGLKTKPWRHQIDAYQFAMERLTHGSGAAMLALEMGCVAGAAALIINRGGNARRMTLRELHFKFHGGHSRGRRWNPAIPCYTRSLIGGEIRLNRILNVMAQGVKPVVRVTLASGKSIRVTADHEIACPEGKWVEAAKLAPNDVVLTNGIPACRACGGTRRVTTYRYAKHVGVCRRCIGKMRRVKGRVIDKDGYVRLYRAWDHPRANAAGQVYEHIVVMEQALGRPISRQEHVHHKNGIRHDNRP